MTGRTGGNDSWTGMRVLLATAEPAHPAANGGIQASAHDLLVGLSGVLGSDARLLSAARPGDSEACRMRLDRLGVAYTQDNGVIHYDPGPYPAALTDASTFLDCFDDLVRRWQPDVIVAQAAGWRDIVTRARAARKPVVHWLHGWLGLQGEGNIPEADLLLANSAYTSEQVLKRFNLCSETYHPPVEPGRVQSGQCACASGSITMINPHPSKGIELFLGLARRFPARRFVAVDCWGTPPYIELAIRRQPNIKHLEPRSDMREVYAETALLVVPTTSDETFGRVVVEAQLNGVPVLASDRGALPDVVGGGGQVVSADAPLETWAGALETLTSPDGYARWSEAARLNAKRFDFEESIRHFARLVDAVRYS
jgi:glycosyltransferase involved in cell wall biosynthesis